MAALPKVAAPVDPHKALKDEVKDRLDACRRQKQMDSVDLDIREAYFFTKPRLARSISSTSAPMSRVRDEDELATGIGSEANEDFATEIINGFFPPHVPWCESKPGETVPDEAWDKVKDQVEKIDGTIFKGIRASNFDAELAQALVPEGGIGTVALWIEDKVAHDPLNAMHVPLRELEINVGPDGNVDDRFVVRYTRGRNVKSVFRDIAIPAKAEEKIKKKPNELFECAWGFWRDWDQPNDVVWKSVYMIAGEVIPGPDYRGEGSCPLIVMRFAPDSLHAYGNGPTIDCLPMLRIVDALAVATQEQAGRAANPSIAYPDDGTLNFEGGIQEGKAYPKRPGSKGEIEPLYIEGNANLGFFSMQDLEKSIRRKHFADYPEQPGKTPPTATQWLDEMVKSQRRIGTPGAKFWKEGPAEIYLRFRFLLTKRGTIKPLQANGRDIAIRPSNPATKAQEQQEVQVAMNLLEIGKNAFPTTMQAAVDELKTIENIKEKLGDKLVVLRDPEVVTGMVQNLLSQAQGAMGGGVPGAPPGAGAPPGP